MEEEYLERKRSDINKHGLSRYISADIRREIKKRCGFGCVVCGSAFYEYEHIDPEWHDAIEHNADKMTLLCGSCHDRVTKGFLSKQTVTECNTDPECLKSGFSYGAFDIGRNSHPEISMGNVKSTNVRCLLRIFGKEVISISPPTEDKEPFKVSAHIFDDSGKEILFIKDNEWLTPIDNWDVEVVGPRICIRRKSRDVQLKLRVEPPKRIVFEQISLLYLGHTLLVNENKPIKFIFPDGNIIKTTGMSINGSDIGIDIDRDGFSIGIGGNKSSIQIDTLSAEPTKK